MKLRTRTILSWSALICATFMAIPVLVDAGAAKAAEGRFISCPLKLAHTSVQGHLTPSWWSTTQRGGLTSVRVLNVGGQPTLLCTYRAYNKAVPVMRRFAKGVKSCKPTGNGFRCQ